MIGVIGDVHGDFYGVQKIIQENPGVSHWFQVGDLGRVDLAYPRFPDNFHFIHGNHEEWDEISLLSESVTNFYLRSGSLFLFEDGARKFSVAALGGNYSSNFYNKKRKELCGDRRRHFVEEEVSALQALHSPVDILITHEAPSPFSKGGRDMGQPILTQLLKKLRPKIHFFGHHHYFGRFSYDGIPSVGLEYSSRSYVLYDLDNNEVVMKPIIY